MFKLCYIGSGYAEALGISDAVVAVVRRAESLKFFRILSPGEFARINYAASNRSVSSVLNGALK